MSNSKAKDSGQTNYHVPNLVRALKILELLTEHPAGLNTTQITSLLDFPRNSVFRITSTLLESGYLIRDEETKVFQLSQKLLTMGYSALSEQNLVEKSLGPMRKLRDIIKETVPLGILNGYEGLIIEEIRGLHSFRYVLEPGRKFNLHTSAPGKAIVAFLPDEKREEVVKKIKFTVYNERTISNKQDYINVLDQVRKTGYAVDHAEEIEGMHCVGAPIFNRHGYPVAAIWITGPSFRVREKDFKKIGPKVKKTGLRISKALGYFTNIKLTISE